MVMEYPSGYPTGAPSNILTENPSSKPIYLTISHPDVLKRGSQEAQVSVKICRTILIIHIISYLSSRQRVT